MYYTWEAHPTRQPKSPPSLLSSLSSSSMRLRITVFEVSCSGVRGVQAGSQMAMHETAAQGRCQHTWISPPRMNSSRIM
jgi:hypothetical protein